MIELSKTQNAVLKVLKDTYKKDTVTRAEINALVKKKVIKNPSWLKSDKFKVDRGVYTLDIDSDTKSESKSTETKKMFRTSLFGFKPVIFSKICLLIIYIKFNSLHII